MNIKNKFKKAIFGGLAALVLASAGCNKSNPINPEEPKIAAKLLQDNRALINPAILSNLDYTKTLWLASDINEYLSLFQEESQYQRLEPASRCSLIHNSEEWYETQVPVAGMEFTVIQFENNTHKWAQYGHLKWEGIVVGRSGGKCLKLPKKNYPTLIYDNCIRLDTLSSSKYLSLTKDILPVDADQLKNEWKLVGDWNGWSYENGLPAIEFTSEEIKFNVSGIHGKVNIKSTSKINTIVWGRFGHLGTGELDGYKHPLIKYNESTDEAAINIP